MKTGKLIAIIAYITIVSGCKMCSEEQKFVFKTMKINKATIDSLYICDKCDSADTCVKRLIFQFTDSTSDNNTINFYLSGWIAYKRPNIIDPEILKLEITSKDTTIDIPFTFANIDWTRAEIRDFLKELPGSNCSTAEYAYIELSAYIDEGGGKRYLSLRATAFDVNGIKLFSAPLKSNKSPNPRPPYPPEG